MIPDRGMASTYRQTVSPILSLATLAVAAAVGAAAPPRPASLDGLDPMVAARIEEAFDATVARPGDADRWLELGRVYHAHQLLGPAAECYAAATERAAGEPKAWYALALARAELGEPRAALAALDEARRLAPGYAPIHWRRGRWLTELGLVDQAELAFRQAIRADPGDPAGPVGLARTLIARGEPREAVPILQQVLSDDPANGVAGQLLGGALRSLGEEKAARRTLALATGMGAYFPDPWHEEILDAATGVGNRLRLASARLARGEVAAVVAELEALRRDHPDDVGLLNKLAEAHLARGAAEPALAVLTAALELDPDEFATLIHLAQAERLRGDVAAALAWADRAVAANPRFWQAHFTRAGLLHRAGRLPECLAALGDAMRAGAHQSPDAWLMRGDAELQLGRWRDAAETFGQAARRFPFLAQAFVGLAYARAEQGELAAARAALAEAAELAGEDATTAAIRARIAEQETGG